MSEPGFGALREVVRKSAFKWRYLDNLVPSLSYQIGPKPQRSAEARRLLADLNAAGIAVTSSHALFGTDSLFRELQGTFGAYERELEDELAAARLRGTEQHIEKAFKFSYVVGRRKLSMDDVLVRFAIQESIVGIANDYFGMYTHLRFINVWRTFATPGPARDSQLWHRDRDDRFILKVFVYLSDVDESAGPFTYAPGTHLKSSPRLEPKGWIERKGGPKRVGDDQMAEVVPRDRWIQATGPAGTIIFADTRGYHCGGRSTQRDRVMAINMFTSSACAKRPDFVIETGNRSQLELTKEQEFALFA
jgi:hypothetical protein